MPAISGIGMVVIGALPAPEVEYSNSGEDSPAQDFPHTGHSRSFKGRLRLRLRLRLKFADLFNKFPSSDPGTASTGHSDTAVAAYR